MFYSPLRYPGGKNRLSKFISKICLDNSIDGHYIEPYAGGASVALCLLLEKKVKKVTINDFDRSIYAFWYSVLNFTDELCDLIERVELSVGEWEKQRKIQKNKENEELLQLGFSTFYLNRVNRSGIILGGLIGGVKQRGEYKMDCRFNKENLIKRIRLIAESKKQIVLSNKDALDLLKSLKRKPNRKNTIVYLDPPYYLKGSLLYKNSYQHKDHKEIGRLIKTITNVHWIISYDNVPEMKNIYSWVCKKYEYFLTHSAYKAKKGREILFFSNKLNVSNFELIPTYKLSS